MVGGPGAGCDRRRSMQFQAEPQLPSSGPRTRVPRLGLLLLWPDPIHGSPLRGPLEGSRSILCWTLVVRCDRRRVKGPRTAGHDAWCEGGEATSSFSAAGMPERTLDTMDADGQHVAGRLRSRPATPSAPSAQLPLAQVPQKLRRLVQHAYQSKRLTDLPARQACRLRGRDSSVGCRDRVAMWIGRRKAQKRVDAVDQQIADRVLHVLGFVMHFVPGEAERVDEKQFDQPVTSQNPQRQIAAPTRSIAHLRTACRPPDRCRSAS